MCIAKVSVIRPCIFFPKVFEVAAKFIVPVVSALLSIASGLRHRLGQSISGQAPGLRQRSSWCNLFANDYHSQSSHTASLCKSCIVCCATQDKSLSSACCSCFCCDICLCLSARLSPSLHPSGIFAVFVSSFNCGMCLG